MASRCAVTGGATRVEGRISKCRLWSPRATGRTGPSSRWRARCRLGQIGASSPPSNDRGLVTPSGARHCGRNPGTNGSTRRDPDLARLGRGRRPWPVGIRCREDGRRTRVRVRSVQPLRTPYPPVSPPTVGNDRPDLCEECHGALRWSRRVEYGHSDQNRGRLDDLDRAPRALRWAIEHRRHPAPASKPCMPTSSDRHGSTTTVVCSCPRALTVRGPRWPRRRVHSSDSGVVPDRGDPSDAVVPIRIDLSPYTRSASPRRMR